MLNIKSLSQITTTEETENRIQGNIAAALNPVLQTPVLDGTLVERLVIPAGGKLTVAHGLGRPALGALVVDASAAVSNPYRLTADQTSPNGAAVLTFATGAGATVSLWVF